MTAATAAAPPRTSRARFAAVDGYRGLFVVLVVLYHFGITALVGGWVGINHFFVFSGFLIGRLLLHERVRTGTINAFAFYRRRARRILPAMLILVTAVVAHTYLVEDATQQNQFGGDAVATIGFYLNWRLISRQDSYFDMLGHPSPLRHAWTLSVEEQFYVLAPFVVLLICLATRRRGVRVAIPLALAGLSAWWTAHLGFHGIASLPRLYYGTDTRCQALLVGLAAAFLLGRGANGRFPPRISRGSAELLGWVGLLLSLSALFVLSPTSPWAYNNGGILVYAIAAALMGASAVDPRDLFINRIFGWEPLAFLGRISYGIYLYHWPLAMWLPLHGLPTVLSATILLAVTIALAALSFRYVEAPILQHGVRGLLGRGPMRRQHRTVAIGSVLVVALGAAGLWHTPAPAVPQAPMLVAGTAAYRPGAASHRLAVVGDSVGASLVKGFVQSRYADLTVDDFAAIGCDEIAAPAYADGTAQPESDACAQWRRTWPATFADHHDTSVLVVADAHFLTAHVAPDGTIAQPRSHAAATLINAALDRIWADAHRSGARSISVLNLPCRRIDPLQLDESVRFFAAQGSDDASVAWANGVIAAWVAAHPQAQLDDVHSQLCADGYRPTVHGVPLYHDTLHFTPQAAAMLWTWLAPRLRTLDSPH